MFLWAASDADDRHARGPRAGRQLHGIHAEADQQIALREQRMVGGQQPESERVRIGQRPLALRRRQDGRGQRLRQRADPFRVVGSDLQPYDQHRT